MTSFEFFGTQQRSIAAAVVEPGEPSRCAVIGSPSKSAAEPIAPTDIFLVLDSGERWEIGNGVVLGRNPSASAKGVASRTTVALNDSEGLVSREHLAIVPHTASIVAIDLASTNGTVLVRNGESANLPPNKPVNIQAGDRLLVGGRVVAIEA